MWDLTGTYVAANYRRVQPSTQFGTRSLRFIKIVVGGGGPDLTTDQNDSDSAFSRAVLAMQNFGESWAVGTPDATTFMMVISDDTAQDANTDTNEIGGWGQAEADVARALGSGTVTISNWYLYGGGFDN